MSAAESPGKDYDDHLYGLGLKIKFEIVDRRRVPLWLCVANKHTRLGEIFANTPWSEGGWKQGLGNLPLASSSDGTEYFRGAPRTRAVNVPLELLGELPKGELEGDDVPTD